MEINILENEFWWGGSIDDGTLMPFSRSTALIISSAP